MEAVIRSNNNAGSCSGQDPKIFDPALPFENQQFYNVNKSSPIQNFRIFFIYIEFDNFKLKNILFNYEYAINWNIRYNLRHYTNLF